jgi:ferredoxin
MAIKIDKNKCIGCGTCTALCDECFEMNTDGKAKIISQKCNNCNLKEVVASCAVDAIEISSEK